MSYSLLAAAGTPRRLKSTSGDLLTGPHTPLGRLAGSTEFSQVIVNHLLVVVTWSLLDPKAEETAEYSLM